MKTIPNHPELAALFADIVAAFGTPERIVDELDGPVPEEESRRLLGIDYMQMRFRDFGLVLTEGDAAQKAYFLPAALAYVRDRREDDGDVADWLIRAAGSYAYDELTAKGLFERVFDEVEKTFWGWLGLYRTRRINPKLAHVCVRDSSLRDSCLNELCACCVMSRGKILAQEMMRRMSQQRQDEKISAHFLDMIFGASSNWGLYPHLHHDNVFHSLAHDIGLLNTHWIIAKHLIADVCPKEYVDAIERMVKKA